MHQRCLVSECCHLWWAPARDLIKVTVSPTEEAGSKPPVLVRDTVSRTKTFEAVEQGVSTQAVVSWCWFEYDD